MEFCMNDNEKLRSLLKIAFAVIKSPLSISMSIVVVLEQIEDRFDSNFNIVNKDNILEFLLSLPYSFQTNALKDLLKFTEKHVP